MIIDREEDTYFYLSFFMFIQQFQPTKEYLWIVNKSSQKLSE